MKTKLLMTSSALFCGIIGILLLFLPNEIAEYLNVEPTIIIILFLKIFHFIYIIYFCKFNISFSSGFYPTSSASDNQVDG